MLSNVVKIVFRQGAPPVDGDSAAKLCLDSEVQEKRDHTKAKLEKSQRYVDEIATSFYLSPSANSKDSTSTEPPTHYIARLERARSHTMHSRYYHPTARRFIIRARGYIKYLPLTTTFEIGNGDSTKTYFFGKYCQDAAVET